MKILTFGVFDYFHIGHLRLFKQCKKYADYVIVAVQDSDFIKKFKPDAQIFYSTEVRMELIKSLREVNEVIKYNEINIDFLKTVDFDILALGEDHKGKRFDDVIEWCKLNNKQVVRLKRTPGICSSEIKKSLK